MPPTDLPLPRKLKPEETLILVRWSGEDKITFWGFGQQFSLPLEVGKALAKALLDMGYVVKEYWKAEADCGVAIDPRITEGWR